MAVLAAGTRPTEAKRDVGRTEQPSPVLISSCAIASYNYGKQLTTWLVATGSFSPLKLSVFAERLRAAPEEPSCAVGGCAAWPTAPISPGVLISLVLATPDPLGLSPAPCRAVHRGL